MIDPRAFDDTREWVYPLLPNSLPPHWREVERNLDGAKYIGKRPMGVMSVIVSGAVERDGNRWLHVSCARPDRLPTWDDLTFVKATWIGPDRYALQVFPPVTRYVNIHPFCLHLWHCLDGWPLPEFSGQIDGVTTI